METSHEDAFVEFDPEQETERPGDELYPTVEKHLKFLSEKEEEVENGLTQILVEDLLYDAAFHTSVAKLETILEYMGSRQDGFKPLFTADDLFRTSAKIGKLVTINRLLDFYKVPEEAKQLALSAEVERLWYDPTRVQDKAKKADAGVSLKLPDEVIYLLRAIAKPSRSK